MIRYFLLVLVACCTLVQPALASRPFLAIVGWGNVGDPDGDCSIGIKDGSVTFGIPGTPHDYAAEIQQWNCPRIMCTARGDFIAQVKVTGTFEPKGPSTTDGKPYNGAGILIVADAQNHLSLQRGASLQDGHVRHFLNFELRKDGKCVESHRDIDLNIGEDTYLRVERHGNKFFGSGSSDGANWHSYGSLEASFPKNLDVGVEVVNSSADSFNCAFAEYQLFRSSSGNMWDPKGTDEPEQSSQAPDAGVHNGKSASSALPKQEHSAAKPVVADSKEKAKTETAANNN